MRIDHQNLTLFPRFFLSAFLRLQFCPFDWPRINFSAVEKLFFDIFFQDARKILFQISGEIKIFQKMETGKNGVEKNANLKMMPSQN